MHIVLYCHTYLAVLRPQNSAKSFQADSRVTFFNIYLRTENIYYTVFLQLTPPASAGLEYIIFIPRMFKLSAPGSSISYTASFLKACIQNRPGKTALGEGFLHYLACFNFPPERRVCFHLYINADVANNLSI